MPRSFRSVSHFRYTGGRKVLLKQVENGDSMGNDNNIGCDYTKDVASRLHDHIERKIPKGKV